MKCRAIESQILRQRYRVNLKKELFRKSIHIFIAWISLMISSSGASKAVLLAGLAIYAISEFLRINGREIPIVSSITVAASRKRDENRIVLGPITLCLGIFFTMLAFPAPVDRSVGICALAFGDGIASLAGRTFGRTQLPFQLGKTVEGSLSCFAAIFVSTFAWTGDSFDSLASASVGMLVEMMPLKDIDNLLIPLSTAAVVHCLA